jgi:hypothetical protein
MKKTLYTALMSLPALLFIGCSGGGGASSSSASEGTAFYIDSAVEGVSVTCGAKVSLTDSRGAFTYVEGEICSFSIGDIILRQEGGISEGESVFENNIQVAQFLQSLDTDNNPSNGISISAEVIQILKDNAISTLPNTDAELLSIISILQNKEASFFGNYVSQAEAQEHLNQTASSLSENHENDEESNENDDDAKDENDENDDNDNDGESGAS